MRVLAGSLAGWLASHVLELCELQFGLACNDQRRGRGRAGRLVTSVLCPPSTLSDQKKKANLKSTLSASSNSGSVAREGAPLPSAQAAMQ